jgi:hypothetical protein
MTYSASGPSPLRRHLRECAAARSIKLGSSIGDENRGNL